MDQNLSDAAIKARICTNSSMNCLTITMIIFNFKCFSSTPKNLNEMDLSCLSLNQFPYWHTALCFIVTATNWILVCFAIKRSET